MIVYALIDCEVKVVFQFVNLQTECKGNERVDLYAKKAMHCVTDAKIDEEAAWCYITDKAINAEMRLLCKK